MKYICAIISILSMVTNICEPANILIILIWPGRSHYLMFRPIIFELARRGHNVTAITAFKEEHHPENYRQIFVDTGAQSGDKPKVNLFDFVNVSDEDRHNILAWKGGIAVTEAALNSSQVQKFLNDPQEFDIVISEQFYQEAFYALSHKYNAPLVLITTYGNCMRHSIITRNPLQLSTSFSEFIELKDTHSFLSRLYNLYFTLYEYFWWNYSYLQKQELLVRKYVPNLSGPIPSLYEIQKNTSLFLMNRHFSFENPIAYLPNFVEIGGIHLEESNSKIPNDLQKILDESNNGIIYLSFGTSLRFSDLPPDKIDAFLKAFKKLKQTVLLKFDGVLESKPDNVVTRKWFPQKEVLGHQNIKFFIHHGGIFGVQEAIVNGVPILGIPVFGDQYRNLIQAENLGIGRVLRFNDINEGNLDRLFKEFLDNTNFKINAVELSKRFKDRPMSALDTAMYWIEFVIRNRGANFIKNPAIKIHWLEYFILDIEVISLGLTIIVILILFKCLMTMIALFWGKETKLKVN